MKLEKSRGVLYSDEITCVRLQEIILGYKEQCPISKVLIDAEKMTFYKFGLPVGRAWHNVNGIYFFNGYLSCDPLSFPAFRDLDLIDQLLILFNLK